MSKRLNHQFRLVSSIHGHCKTSAVESVSSTVVLDPHLCYRAIGNDDDIIGAILEVHRTPIDLDHLTFSPAIQDNLVSDPIRLCNAQ
jgi:hypothetical protein